MAQMNKIEEHDGRMTIYYRKCNGEIKMISDGIHDMSIFGDERSDYELIWDCLVIDKVQEIKAYPNLFFINHEMHQVEVKQNLAKVYKRVGN
ncbi:hypothetical protein [Turicibacter sanguinis]|uniref:hypothetical protein n=1 Tax=Turicibacter sanguinis TaxID=154288 RepID=UPI0021D4C3F8|nr:hypothetical protein [Turicibacter sanguinis]MCU7195557.1 hypothetical protein [Turicibacter sanguinis]